MPLTERISVVEAGLRKNRVVVDPRWAMIFSCFLVLQHSAAAQGILHVDASRGNDAVTRAKNSAASPWRTIGRAAWGSVDRSKPKSAEGARAGDTVLITAGNYDFDGKINHRWGVVYNPVNQGTSAAKITFRALGPVKLTAPATASPVIGCFERSFIAWQGPFDVSEAGISISPDTGTVVLASAEGCGVDGIFIDGNGAPAYDDNHTGVRIEGCQSCYVRNATIRNVLHQRGNHNGSGVMLYNSNQTLVENNLIQAVDNAVFIKGVFAVNAPQSQSIVRHNLMIECGECIIVSDSRESRIYQNVIRNAEIALNLLAREAGENFHPVGDWFVNNTIDAMTSACVLVGGGPWHDGVRVWNNIFTGCPWVNYREAPFVAAAAVSWEHNVYHGFTKAFAKDSSPGDYSLGNWQKRFAQDSAPLASASADPMFANAAAADFRLCTGRGRPEAGCGGASAALRQGIDLLDLNRNGSTTDVIPAGAYVDNAETIGPLRSGIRK